jgi:hypothetical protein
LLSGDLMSALLQEANVIAENAMMNKLFIIICF